MPKLLDLKSTLNLPKTAFPMKANLPQNEPRILAEWEQGGPDGGLYARIQQARAEAPTYVLHDGPPYATGSIHLGTGLNKILKDMVVKSKSMSGFRAPYVPGWDCHGLPIETQVEKELGGKGKVPPAEFRKLCRTFASRFVDQHRRDFKRLGVFGQWDKPYLTMSPEYEACIADAFLTFLEKGYAYRGLKPVYWCIYDRTALAEAEVEYEDHTSPSIWIRYPVISAPAELPRHTGQKLYALVWTTTPWTLPASLALAFRPHFEYVLADDDHGNTYILARELVGKVMQETGATLRVEPKGLHGKAFEGARFQHPFLDREIPGVLADYVTLEQGTGVVHTAPGHGADDYRTGQKYGLPAYAPLDDDGRFVEGLPDYMGKTIFEANPAVIALLKSRGALFAEGKLQHSYPHCWRCHNPVIFRATEQWFIQLDAGGGNVPVPKAPPLRQTALEQISKVQWTPGWGMERMRSMIAERPDWCVSRQRFWGVPIPVFYCDGCGKLFDDVKALYHVIEWFRKEGADAWFNHAPEELLPAGTKCSGCGAAQWRKENDILDVWFDSGSSHLAVLDPAAGLTWPADMYLEGPDQYRGWFHSSLLIGAGVRGAAPYRHVLTHGWTLDEHGRPMSKSLGNVVLPTEICEKWGADLLRLWVASQDYTADVRMSDNVMKQLSEAYRKIRNTFRFALGNLADFDPALNAVPEQEMGELDRWMLQRTRQLVLDCEGFYRDFDFHRVYHALHDFCVVELSSFYFDLLKDRLYTFAAHNSSRRSAQTAMHRIASALVRLLAPMLVYTAEEIWKYLPRQAGEPDSVHLALFPKAGECRKFPDEALDARWSELVKVRAAVLGALEQARAAKTINGGLEARVELFAEGTLGELLGDYAAWFPALFIVSQVKLVDRAPEDAVRSEALPGLAIAVRRALGTKCERCWNFSTRVGESADYPTVCERCVAALNEIEGDGSQSSGASS